MRRLLLPIVILAALTLVACSSDESSDPPADPMNGRAELDRPVDRGYDRTDWDPAALTAAMALAERTGTTSVGCIDPGPVSFAEVKTSYELVQLPMPGAVVGCYSEATDEDLEFSGFTSEQAKTDFIDAKAELICGRAMAPESDPSVTTRFDGIVYVDAGDVIIEPDSYVVRDLLAAELQATPSKMCADAVGDRPRDTTAS